MKRTYDYREYLVISGETVYLPVCSQCGSVVLDAPAHNRWHWKIMPSDELEIGDEVYVRSWGRGTDDGRTICSKEKVTGQNESVVELGKYNFRWGDVFPADSDYGFDPYWKEQGDGLQPRSPQP